MTKTFGELPVGAKFTRGKEALVWSKWELFTAYGTFKQNAATWAYDRIWHYDLIADDEVVTLHEEPNEAK